jgi:hypothetical protein
MKSRLVSLVSGLLLVMTAILVATPAPGWAQESKVKRLVFASAGFDESNAWTIARPDHLQFDRSWRPCSKDPKTSEYPGFTKWSHSKDFLEWTFEARASSFTMDGEFTSADVKHDSRWYARLTATPPRGGRSRK